MKLLCHLIIFSLLFITQIAGAVPQPGTYSNGLTTIVLTQDSKDIRASIVIDGYPIELTVSTIDERTLKGSMNVFGEQSEFLMIATDQGLLLKSEEEELLLTKRPPSSANDTPIPRAKKIETKKQNTYREDNPKVPRQAIQKEPFDSSSVTFDIAKMKPAKKFKKASKTKMTKETVEKFNGYAFRKPKTWLSKKENGNYLLGHKRINGMILIVSHPLTSRQQGAEIARNGIAMNDSITLRPSKALTTWNKNGLAGEFTARPQNPLTAYAISLFSKHGGVSIYAIVDTDKYNDDYPVLVQAIAKSVRLFKPKTPPEDKVWKERLTNRKLSYLRSSSSSGYDGSYTASSDKTRIGLCPGHFTYYSSSSYSVNAGGGSGSGTGSGSSAMGNGTGKGNGSWKTLKRNGKSYLQLLFYNGSIKEYELGYEDYKTYLDGVRYFKTSGAQGPDCN